MTRDRWSLYSVVCIFSYIKRNNKLINNAHDICLWLHGAIGVETGRRYSICLALSPRIAVNT